MRGAEFFWCLAGGHAVAHVLGRSHREHGDIDIVIIRTQLLEAQRWLRGWRLYAAGAPEGLRPWIPNEQLPAQIHDVWCHREGSHAWELQIMVQESDGDSWYFRRDARVSGRVADLATIVDDVPCLRMDLQLLFKSRDPRPKDETDFRALLPALSDAERKTLAYWLRLVYPSGHPWSSSLT
jgi:hypothetical protein